MLYLIPFLESFSLSAAIIAAMLFLFRRLRVRKGYAWWQSHESKLKRLGGSAIVASFVITLLIDKNLIITHIIGGVLAAMGVILVFGVLDDLLGFTWKTQLFFQVALAVFIYIWGVRIGHIANPLGGTVFDLESYVMINFLAVLVWVLILTNSMNWLDGVDGLSGGVTLIGGLTLFLLTMKPEVNQPPVGIITMALSGSVLGFLLFNFYPAKLFAGTAGAMFMGFSLAFIAIFAGEKIATALLVMSIPVVDFAWVIGERLRSGRSIFIRDRSHFHYKLLEIGWTPRKIAVLLYGVTVLISLIALNTRALGKVVTLCWVAVIMAALLLVLNKNIIKKKFSRK